MIVGCVTYSHCKTRCQWRDIWGMVFCCNFISHFLDCNMGSTSKSWHFQCHFHRKCKQIFL